MDSNRVDVREIVSQVLNSQQLRQSLENTVRSLTPDLASSRSPLVSGSLITANSGSNTLSTLMEPTTTESRRQELSRLFPTINSRQRRVRRNRISLQHAFVPKPFHKDIILLKSKDSFCTLKGVVKSNAFETDKVGFCTTLNIFLGYGLPDVQFNVSWSETEIMNHLRSIFPILDGIPFEILVPIGGRVVRPTLLNGSMLDGITLKRIFSQKIIYLRPLVNVPIDSDNYFENGEECSENEHIDHETVGFETLDEGNASEMTPLVDILKELHNNITEEVSYFNIFRADIFSCCIRTMKRKTFNPFNRISVNFTDSEGQSEGAVDSGGPKREMFRLTLQYLGNSSLFIGSRNKFISLDRILLEKNLYFFAGQIIALSLVHGGPGPHFFSETFYKAICEGFENCEPSYDFIEHEFVEIIKKLESLDNLVQMNNYIMQEQIFAIVGCYAITKEEDKEKIVKDTQRFCNFHRIRPSFDQFCDGLNTCGLLDIMRKHPEVFKDVMCSEKGKITYNVLNNLFEINFSEHDGSNKRNVESQVVAFWRDYLLDCEEDEPEDYLEKILVFVTGADHIPPLGFQSVKLMFQHDSNNVYPKANTCTLELHLPVIHKTYADFKEYMHFGINNTTDFGFA